MPSFRQLLKEAFHGAIVAAPSRSTGLWLIVCVLAAVLTILYVAN